MHFVSVFVPLVLLTLLVGCQEEHLACKKLNDGLVICQERGADCLHMFQLMPLHPKTPSSLASFKSRLVLPFWYQLTQVVLEKRPLNGYSSSSCVCFLVLKLSYAFDLQH